MSDRSYLEQTFPYSLSALDEKDFNNQANNAIGNQLKSIVPPKSPTIGQQWCEVDENGLLVEEWFWNGVYWLSTQIYTSTIQLNHQRSFTYCFQVDLSENIFILNTFFTFRTFNPHTTDRYNYYYANLIIFRQGNVNSGAIYGYNSGSIEYLNTSSYDTKNTYREIDEINMHIDAQAIKLASAGVEFITLGGAGLVLGSGQLNYRKAKAL